MLMVHFLSIYPEYIQPCKQGLLFRDHHPRKHPTLGRHNRKRELCVFPKINVEMPELYQHFETHRFKRLHELFVPTALSYEETIDSTLRIAQMFVHNQTSSIYLVLTYYFWDISVRKFVS